MKFHYLFVFIFLLSVDAQRRSVKSELLSENEPQPKSARRGRARFTITSESPQIEEQTKRSDPIRRVVPRRKPETHAEPVPSRGYQVDEVVDDVPIETFRKTGKPRVFTESKFEAKNAPLSNALFQPSTTESLEEIIKSIGSNIADAASSSSFALEPSSSPLPSSLEPLASEITPGEYTRIENEVSQIQPETTTPLTVSTTRRVISRSKSDAVSNAPTVNSRVRVRARPTKKPEEPTVVANSGRVVNRGSRRRPEAVSTEQPTASRFQPRSRQPTVESTEAPRSRTFEPRSRQPVAVAAESVDQPTRSRTIPAKTRSPSVISSAESAEIPSRSRSGRRIGTTFRRADEAQVTEKASLNVPPQARRTSVNRNEAAPTFRGRSRSFSREVPPVIDEQKLEVLPLFERESKTVKPTRKVVSKRRNSNSAEEVETSATENDVKLTVNLSRQSPPAETRSETSSKRRKVTIRPVGRSHRTTLSTTRATPKNTKATTTIKPTVQTSPPIIKESVISEITEVTSKRTITRSKSGRNKVELPKLAARSSRKSETTSVNVKPNKSSLTSSEEEIEDSDNYPEPFKALIQAKKQKKESRPQPRLVTASPIVTKTAEVVSSSPSTTAAPVISSEASRQLDDLENELDPIKSARPTRRRFSQNTEKVTRPTRKNKFSRSTVAPSATTEYRVHTKFNTDQESTTSSSVKPGRSFSPKPPRGLYSSRKSKESLGKPKSTTQQIPTLKKTNRYSSRYRNDASSRGAIRTSTNAPAYLPTIPTITPPTTPVKSSIAYQDKDLGVEIISFDDPVNTVPSANLVSGEYLASSTENHLTNSLVPESQTKSPEKPVSIIERIINSITAISTTEVPDVTRPTFPQETSTKASAILKLATKKSTRLDKTQTTQKIPTVTVTSETPTTIIERIISSLSAIQADNNTDTKHFKSKQVGTNFNTISSPSTTPITRVTKSTLYAPISTSVNPLFVLNDVSNEQTLQKRTIEQLLALLNTMTSPSPHSTPLVVVTPKTTSYVVGNSATPATTTTTTPTTTTTEPTTSQLFTSPSLNVNISLSPRANFPAVRHTTTPTTTTLETQAPTTLSEPTTQSSTVASAENTIDSLTSTTQSSTVPSVEDVINSVTSTTQSTADITTTPTLTSTDISSTTSLPTSDYLSNEISALPLLSSVEVTSLSTSTDQSSADSSSTTDSSVESTTTSSVDSSTTSSTDFSTATTSTDSAVDTENNFVYPSTIPALINFEVSPGSVSVFSANDVSNAITPDDSLSTAVTISGRFNLSENVITTQSAPTQTTTLVPNSTANSSTPSSVTVDNRNADPNSTEIDSSGTTTISNSISDVSTTTSSSTPGFSTTVGVTMNPHTTTDGALLSSTTPLAAVTTTTNMPDSSAATTLASSTSSSSVTTDSSTTQDISSNTIDTTDSSVKANQTSTASPQTNSTSRASGRSGRLLSVVQDPVQNSIESSTARSKDYFIFAVLNNNTVLRKRPSNFPTKDTPYLVVGVYPNNTIVRKFPNGTLVPMEPIIRVSGFDTRENPPLLPEITSNQVTPDQGSRPDNKNLQTVDQNTVPAFEANALSLSTVNNVTSTTGSTPSSTQPSVRANPLSVSSTVSSTTQSSTSTSTSSTTSSTSATSTTSESPTTSTAPTATLPTLTEILNGKTVQAFNSIINISDLSKTQTLDVDPKTNKVLNADALKNKIDVVFRWKPVTSATYTFRENKTTTYLPSTTMTFSTLSNRILDDFAFSTALPTTTQQPRRVRTTTVPTTTSTVFTTTASPPSTTTYPPTTTFTPTTTFVPTTLPSTTATFVYPDGTTVLPLIQPATTTVRTTTFLPQFLSTLFSTLRPSRSTEAPISIVTPISNKIEPTTTPQVEINTVGDLLTAGSTRRSVRTTTRIPRTTTDFTTLPFSTTGRHTRRRTTTVPTTTVPPTTTVVTSTVTIPTTTAPRNIKRSTTSAPETTTSATKRLRELTDQQKQDLQTLAQLEMEQASILRQLAFLTNLNFANTKPSTEKNDLANRIIALAVERDKEREETKTSLSVKSEGSRQGKQISSTNDQNLEKLVKQLNIATPSTITTEYGNSNDAIIAALLKEQGIGPTTPKVLEDVYSLTTTTKKPRTTTRRPGPLMQSLNWLLNVLAPPTTTTKRPKPKSKPKPKPKPTPEIPEHSGEDLSYQPTHITPVVTPSPRQNVISSLSQDDIKKLIKQLESIQKDPVNSKGLDFSSINSLQNLLNAEGGVQVTSSGSTGTTVRDTTTKETTTVTTTKKKTKSKSRVAKSTTSAPVSSNSIFDDEPTTTARPRITLQPVRLRPVPGIDDNETMVRGQLITAAVNVTRAISSFLGTALQGAATSFQSLLGSGSRVVGSLMQSSSNTSSRPG